MVSTRQRHFHNPVIHPVRQQVREGSGEVAKKNDFNVVKSLLIAPDFSDDFVNDCGLEFEVNLSFITASSLVIIFDGYKNSKLKQFPYQLLMKDVLIKEDRILKAIAK